MAPTLVLLHGFTHTGASWSPVLAELGERYRGIAPDLRGHGESSEAAPVTLEAVLSDIEGLAPARFTLAGYSMGGRLALHFALTHPKRVERLILIGASPGIADREQRKERRRADEQLADWIERSSIEEVADRWERTPVLADQPPKVQAAVREDRLRSTPDGLSGALRGLGTGALASLWGRLGALHVPVVLVAGERDRKFTEIAEQMAAAIPGAQVEVVADVGHAVHLEAPASVAAIVSADRER